MESCHLLSHVRTPHEPGDSSLAPMAAMGERVGVRGSCGRSTSCSIFTAGPSPRPSPRAFVPHVRRAKAPPRLDGGAGRGWRQGRGAEVRFMGSCHPLARMLMAHELGVVSLVTKTFNVQLPTSNIQRQHELNVERWTLNVQSSRRGFMGREHLQNPDVHRGHERGTCHLSLVIGDCGSRRRSTRRCKWPMTSY
jgi:hypothetical protein